MTTTIALTTDASHDDRAVIAAAALAASSGARLVSVHATTERDAEPLSLPAVGRLASAWGKSIDHVPMNHSCCDDVTDTVLDALSRIAPSLVVAGTHGKSGWLQLFSESVAEGIARNVAVPTLIVPDTSRAVVDASTGAFDLRRLLLPVGDAEALHAGVRAAEALVRMTGAADVELVLLHVEDGRPAPEPTSVPASLRVARRSVTGPLEKAILDVAAELDACVVVMPTRGHDGVLDTALGSHTERVVRRSRCPVLSVPLRGEPTASTGGAATD